MDNKSYSKGICWIDDCRIPFVDETEKQEVCKSDKTEKTYDENWGNAIFNFKRTGGNNQGRFPANILVSDDMLNDGKIGQNNSKNQEWGLNDDFKVNEYLVGLKKSGISRIADKGTNSRYYDIDKWFDKIIND